MSFNFNFQKKSHLNLFRYYFGIVGWQSVQTEINCILFSVPFHFLKFMQKKDKCKKDEYLHDKGFLPKEVIGIWINWNMDKNVHALVPIRITELVVWHLGGDMLYFKP